jgi:hypothetical protein
VDLVEAPVGVCASADVIVVSEGLVRRISVFNRIDGALVRRMGSTGNGQVLYPAGVCFLPGDRHFAVVDLLNNRVSVFSVEGEFIRHVGAGVFQHAQSVACTAFGEIVVADSLNHRVVVFAADGEVAHTIVSDHVTGIVIRGSTVFAQSLNGECVVFE